MQYKKPTHAAELAIKVVFVVAQLKMSLFIELKLSSAVNLLSHAAHDEESIQS